MIVVVLVIVVAALIALMAPGSARQELLVTIEPAPQAGIGCGPALLVVLAVVALLALAS